MKVKKLAPVMRGLAAFMAVVLALSTTGVGIADSYRSAIDSVLGTTSYVTKADADSARFASDYETIEDMIAAAKDISVREGEEGTVVMKNDNDVLPLASGTNVTLFGLAAYATYPYAAQDHKAANADAVELVDALADAGLNVNQTIRDMYMNNILNKHEEQVPNAWTGELETSISYDNIYVAAPGDMAQYQIVEVTPDRFASMGAPSNWKDSILSDSVGIVVFARGAGEGNTYAPQSALDSQGNPTGKDPLALSDEELAVVDLAKETCSKVIVLLNTGNTMMISDIAAGGAHEADGIVYIGTINDYQSVGIAHVLTGTVNATGALPDTYPVDFTSIPAVQNFGGGYYADYEIVASNSDPRYPGVEISNDIAGSFGGSATYNGGFYVVEAEGIYVGYKYYETRYYDAIVNPAYNASSAAGTTQSSSWDYNSEIVYTFGHGLSYLPYTQELKSIEVDKTPEGNITAVVAVTNNSSQDGRFLAQLYVQQPYTEYDKTNLVEKSAITFLSSAKVDVKANATEEVEITLPTKYLASYDYKNAKTYILDDGDYYFTAAAGAHDAVNNILAAQGYTPDAEATGGVQIWNVAELDTTTFSVENGVAVTNVADDADLNYWTGEDTVTYLTRQDWNTFPINYNEGDIYLADSPKSDEWIAALRGQLHTIATDNPATEGTNQGIKFNSENIQYEQLEDVNDPFWDTLVSQITIDEAVGAVIHGGSQSDVLTNVDNPIVSQNEGVSGFTATYTLDDGSTFRFNIHSQTLMGSSFNPDLAYEWGLVEGNSGLWLQRYDLWGTGLTQRRTPYNGRNYEYISEDPMLSNRIGYGILQGCADKGIMNGPKHLGFNDQEHNRAGVSAYMTEQKFRETDLRGFQGALEDADALAIMIAFNRIGATGAAHHVGMIQKILRGEWAYTGLISTDMMNNAYYFNPESMIMAGITQVADFGGNDNHINLGEGGVDATWSYLSVNAVKGDAELVEQARENLKYQLYTFANSAVLNVSTERVQTWWDAALQGAIYASAALTVITATAWIVLTVLPDKKKEVK